MIRGLGEVPGSLTITLPVVILAAHGLDQIVGDGHPGKSGLEGVRSEKGPLANLYTVGPAARSDPFGIAHEHADPESTIEQAFDESPSDVAGCTRHQDRLGEGD